MLCMRSIFGVSVPAALVIGGMARAQTQQLDPRMSVYATRASVTGIYRTCSGYVEISINDPQPRLCIDGQGGPYHPDGVAVDQLITDVGPTNERSGTRHRGRMAILGVFLPGIDRAHSVPVSLDFVASGTDFTELRPELYQVFFVGDGLTSAGQRQKFWCPDDGVILALGFAVSDQPGGPACCLDGHQCPVFPTFVEVSGQFVNLAPYIAGVAITGESVGYRAAPLASLSQPTFLAFAVPADGLSPTPPPFTYQWRREQVPLVDGPTPQGSLVVGATSRDLYILNARGGDEGMYDCVVSSACQSVLTDRAPLTVCTANIDGHPGQTVEDLFQFLSLFFSGDSRADVNDSGVVSTQDIFDFLAAAFGPRCQPF